MASEFPKTFYRYNEAGERVGKTFASEGDVEAGWVCFDDLGPAPEAKPAKPEPMETSLAIGAAKKLAGAEEAARRMKESADLLQADLDDARRTIAAQSASIEAYRAFVLEIAHADTHDLGVIVSAAKELGEGAVKEKPIQASKKQKLKA